MPSLILPSRFNQQPQQAVQIARSPLTVGLALAVSGGSGFRDLAGNRLAASNNGISTLAGSVGVGFVAASNASLGAQFANSTMKSSDGAGTGDFTYLAWANPVASTTREFFICSASGNNELYFGANFVVGLGVASGAFSGQTNAGAASGSAAGGVDGNMHMFAYVRRGTTVSLYLDGVMLTSVTASAAPMWQSNSADYVGGYSSSGWGISKSVALLLGYNRAVSSVEIGQLYLNPNQVFASPARRLWTVPATGGGITGTLAATEGADTATAAGTVAFPALAGAAAAPEPADTAAGAGTVAYPGVSGSASASEGSDTASASGIVDNSINGAAVGTEASDTGVGAGMITNPPISGTAAPAEGGDTGAAVGTVTFPAVAGAGAASEASDQGAATGSVLSAITGSASAIERGDTAAGFDTLPATKIGGDDVPRAEDEERIEIWEPRKHPAKRDDNLDQAVRAAYANATGQPVAAVIAKPAPAVTRSVPAPEPFDFDEDDLEVLLLSY